VDQRVTGQIVNVLYSEHVKQLKKMDGVWPAAFDGAEGAAPAAREEEEGSGSGSGGAGAGEVEAALQNLSLGGQSGAPPARAGTAAGGDAGEAPDAALGRGSGGESSSESDDDGLPPLTRIQNRRVVEYALSETDSD
jgi:hypothetical protein